MQCVALEQDTRENVICHVIPGVSKRPYGPLTGDTARFPGDHTFTAECKMSRGAPEVKVFTQSARVTALSVCFTLLMRANLDIKSL